MAAEVHDLFGHFVAKVAFRTVLMKFARQLAGMRPHDVLTAERLLHGRKHLEKIGLRLRFRIPR